MQATISAVALKSFIRALTCLSRYGDDLVIYADSEHLTLSATNSSLSAYCRFRYGKMFFSRYRMGGGVNGIGSSTGNADEDVKGQLLVKTLLSILKHRTIEKSVERCELLIIEGAAREEPEEDEDTLESRLIVRLHCKHGIVKTHRLPLLIPTSLLSPGVPESENESRLTIGPRAIKDITEHFFSGRGMKGDPQLVWTFGDTDVDVKSLESSIDAKGRAQLATELTVSAEEYDVYEIYAPPITIAFHLREFNATIAFAESMGSALDLRFTDPAAPLFIDVEGDESECLFIISTSQIQGAPSNALANTRNSSTPNPQQTNVRKRPHPDAEKQLVANAPGSGRKGSETPRAERIKKSMRAVQRVEVPEAGNGSRESSTTQNDERSMPPPSFIPNRSQPNRSFVFRESQNEDLGGMDMASVVGEGDVNMGDLDLEQPRQTQRAKTPLFFPLSQLSQADEQAIRESGLGVEYMDRDELVAMLEGDGEEVEFEIRTQVKGEISEECPAMAGKGEEDGGDSLELFEDEFGPTQEGAMDGRKAFQPLFED
ncbi:Rad9-domain-containing protein [Melanogaster broomeanus]|nr:Rad9-domain-containing protein [Melanogaster broomeanus]